MKKIFAFAVLFAAVSLVACGGEQKKAADEAEAAAVECCGECAEAECTECTEACCGECAEAECAECTEACCGECAEAECTEACCADEK